MALRQIRNPQCPELRGTLSKIGNRVAQRIVALLAGAAVVELAQSFDPAQDAPCGPAQGRLSTETSRRAPGGLVTVSSTRSACAARAPSPSLR